MVDTSNGRKECPVYTLPEDAAQLDEFAFSKVVRGARGTYLNVPCAFDIETTNITNVEKPYAFMYQWQFCICDKVFFGRTWSEFLDLLGELRDRLNLRGRILPIYVHNLSFEFQFMRRFLHWTDVFLKAPRHVLKATADGVFEFRDSYALSNMSLAKFCKNTPDVVFMKYDKEEFDYKKIRTPETELTEKEQGYCYCDVAGLSECIAYLMKEDNLATIPMTSTGYVRRDFRNAYQRNKKLRIIWKQSRLTPELYEICRKAFRGGDTHASYNHVGWDFDEVITSYDISSSYPAAMLLDKYPVTAFAKVDSVFWAEHGRMPNYAALLFCEFRNIEYIDSAGMPYIPIDKCEDLSESVINDNGRVLKCCRYRKEDKDGNPVLDEEGNEIWLDGIVKIWLTDIDFKIIEHDYKWSKLRISDVYVAEYGELPPEDKAKVMEYFRMKTELKNVAGMEYEYGKSKNKLNALYGMRATDIAKRDFIYLDGEYVGKPYDLEQKLNDYYKSRSNFLSYQHGVWCTANARYRLRKQIWKIAETSKDPINSDVLYVDTDSIKCRGDHSADFEEVNAETIRRCEELGFYADDPDGVRHYTGVWEVDAKYDYFKSLGSKRYLVHKVGKFDADGAPVYETTIAGVSKQKGAEFFNKRGTKAFRNGCVIPDAGHLVAYYNDDPLHWIEVDGCRIRTGSNVCLVDEAYTLGITNEYMDIINKVLDKKVNSDYT